jgi:hypothetical protein
MKVRGIRGPNWCEARVSVVITMENMTPVTLMIAPVCDARMPGGIRRAADHPRRQPQLPVEGGLVDAHSHREQRDRNQALKGGSLHDVDTHLRVTLSFA